MTTCIPILSGSCPIGFRRKLVNIIRNQTTEARRSNLRIGDCERDPELRLEEVGLLCSSDLDEAFEIAVKSPDVVGMLTSSWEGVDVAQVLAVGPHSVFDMSLFKLESGVGVSYRLHPRPWFAKG